MPSVPPDIWYRIYDTLDQLKALAEARQAFSGADEFADAFWSSVEVKINLAHEVEAGFTTTQNYAAEVARWSAISGGWRKPNRAGRVLFNTRLDYEALRDNGVISNGRFSAVWSLQLERNHLTHERPDVDPRKVWVASSRVMNVVPSLFLDIQAWAPTAGFTL